VSPNRHLSAMSLLSSYVPATSHHYLHLGDVTGDVTVSHDYVDSVREFAQRETKRRRRVTTWTLLQFSSSSSPPGVISTSSSSGGPGDCELDFLGYFMHAPDLRRITSFFQTFDLGQHSVGPQSYTPSPTKHRRNSQQNHTLNLQT